MARCHDCGKGGLYEGENPNILIDPHTGEGHRCDPGERYVKEGKWRGYKYKDMAKLWARKKEADSKPLG